MRRLPILLILVAASLAVIPARADGPARTDAMVPMSDGVRLEATVYLPSGTPWGAELPLVVRQHGGGSTKDNPYDTGYGMKFVETGDFALLMYSARGHGNSGGIFDFFGERSTQDFSEVLDWVARTFGTKIDTNNVGVSGYSQGGGGSLLPAERDARVKAVAAGQTFADLNEALNPNDCFKFSFATGIFAAAYTVAGARVDDTLAGRWGAQFYTDTEDVGAPPVQPSTTDELRARSPVEGIGALVERRVPVFWTQAWEDQLFPGDHPERILSVLEAQGIPVHYWFSSGGHAVGGDFPAEVAARETAMLDWFDEFLRGVDHGFTTGPKVDYWRRTEAGRPGTWVADSADEWPIPGGAERALFPRSDAALAAEPEAGDTAVGTIANDFASLNVANDSITKEIAGNIPGMGDVLTQIPEDQNSTAAVTFTSAPVEGGFEVTGAPIVDVRYATTATRAMQLDAKVWDLSDAGAQLVWRGCSSVESPAASGTASVKLWPNSHRFEPGHRIALTIAAVDFPVFKPESEPSQTTLIAGTRLMLPEV
ncbi:MAG: CocE/NonD family hydrolase [Actinomycetota bacterium]